MTAADTRPTSGKAWRIAMLSIHSSPTGPLGTRDTGGMSVYVRELSHWLGAAGHQIDIFTCAGDPGAPAALAPNVRMIHVGRGAFARVPKERLPEHLPQMFEAVEAYRREQGLVYDLIHSHYWISGVVGAMAQEQWRRPHLTMFHTLGAAKNTPGSGENETALRMAHEQWLTGVVDHIIVPSPQEQAHLLQLYGAQRARTSMIPCGVNLALFRPGDRAEARRRLGLPPDAPIVLSVGRFAPLKGLESLIRAVALLRPRWPRLELLVVGGDGPQAPGTAALTDLARQLEVSSAVRLVGRVVQGDLPDYYCAADMLALPSHYESFGLVVLEALACGTPVAATAVGVVPEVVQEGLNGTILAAPDAPAVAQGLVRLLLTPSRARPAGPIRQTVQAYDWPRIAAGVASVYTRLLERHDPGQIVPLYALQGVTAYEKGRSLQ
jgi:D-inositol-3-phosphate glycosyltransferase